MLQKRYRKMRKVTKRSPVRRPRAGLKSSKPEIKMWTGSYPALEIVAVRSTATSTALTGKQFLIADFLKNIEQGVGISQRVGLRIFVKKLQISCTTYLCPEGNDATINSCVIRHQIGSAGWDRTAGTQINNYFDSGITYPFTGPNNRKLFRTFKERIVHLNSPLPAQTTALGVGISGTGMVKHYKINVNINKNVKYSPHSNTPADESTSYSLFTMAYTPMQPSNTEIRVACMSTRVRIWFTDD